MFIASLGNPGSEYAHTLHSAGHTLLAALVAHTNFSPLSIAQSRTGTRGRASFADDQGIAFWESPTYMNDSGPTLHSAWKKWCNSAAIARFDSISALDREAGEGQAQELLPRLIVLHDEMELPVGKYSIKTGSGQSARGHNGLKSLLSAPAMNAVRFTRIGVGIGPRPTSREPAVVAKFVMSKLTRMQRMSIEALAGRVWTDIEKIREGRDEAAKPKKQQPKQAKKERKSRESSLGLSEEGTDVESIKEGSGFSTPASVVGDAKAG